MAWLNQLLSEDDLARLSLDERDFLVRRLENVLDFSPEVADVLKRQLGTSLRTLSKEEIRPVD